MKYKLKRNIFILFCIGIITKIFGFGRDIVLSYYYGTSSISDAFLLSMTVTSVIFTIIISAVQSGFIPIYTDVNLKEGKESSLKFLNNVINHLLVFCLMIIIIVSLFPEFFVGIFASGFDNTTREFAVTLTRINIFSIIFTSLILIFTSYLNINNSFTIPAILTLVLNIIIIIFIVISNNLGYKYLAYGYIIASFMQFLFLIPVIMKMDYKYETYLNSNDKYLKEMITVVLPIFVSVSIGQINVIVDKTMASKVSVGAISALTYSYRLSTAIQTIIVVSMVSVIYPKMADYAKKVEITKLKSIISRSIISVFLFLLPLSIICITFNKEIISILFMRGAFNSESLLLTSNAFYYYSMSMVIVGVVNILSKTFYVLGDTVKPTIFSSITFTINIVLNIYLSKKMGVSGIALATTISLFLNMIMLLVSIEIKLKRVFTSKVVFSISIIIMSSILISLFSNNLYNNLLIIENDIIRLILSIIIGLFTYLLLLIISKQINIYEYLKKS